MKPASRLLLAWSLGLCLISPLAARADERAQQIDKIIATAPLPCADAALNLFSQQMRLAAPDLILDGLRASLKYDQAWSAGNENYDRVRAIVVTALAEDERKLGPFFPFDAKAALKEGAERWSVEDARYFATFFSTPAGRLYWTDIMDSAACSGWLDGMDKPPFPSLDGAQKEIRDSWINKLAGAKERFKAKLDGLPPEQKLTFMAGAEKMGPSFWGAPKRLATAANAALLIRAQAALKAHMPKITAISSTYRPK
ncbi:MAG: hypothetical protein V4631_17200 [Pseudomonadota bacterium]